MNCTRSTAGFTLIELLVAITLASLVAVLGAVVLRAALDFHGRANRYLRESEDLRAADRLLLREWSGRRGQDLVAGVNRIEFQTDRLSSVGEEGAARIRYECSEDEAGQVRFERQLLARADIGPDRPGGGGARNSRPGSQGSGGAEATAAGWRVLRTEVLVPQRLSPDTRKPRRQSCRMARGSWRGAAGAAAGPAEAGDAAR